MISQRKRQAIAGILTLIFVTYYTNISLFYHSHDIGGFTVFHSHFHNANHAQNGTHTLNEFSLISALSAFQTLLGTLLVAGIGLSLLLTIIFPIDPEKKVISTFSGDPRLRAPPVLI